VQDAQNADRAGTHRRFVKAQRLAGFVEQDVDTGRFGRSAHRPFAQFREQNHRRAKDARQAHRFGLLRRHADLGQVASVYRGGVEVDPQVRPHHDLVQEEMGQPRGQ